MNELEPVLLRPHWFKSEHDAFIIARPGDKLSTLISNHIRPELISFLRVQINGDDKIYDGEYEIVDGDHIIVYTLPQGGDDSGKSILAMIATIALSIVSPAIGSAVFGQGTFAATALSTGIMMGGSLLIGLAMRSLVKPPSTVSQPDSNPFYQITGVRNEMKPRGAVPRIYGRVRYYPNMILQPRSVMDGDDQYIILCYDFGYGGLWLELGSVKIGETSIGQFTEKHGAWHYKFNPITDKLAFQDRGSITVPVGATLKYGQPITRTTEETDRIAIDIAFPSGLIAWTETHWEVVRIKFTIEAREAGTAQPWETISNFAFQVTSNKPDVVKEAKFTYAQVWMPRWLSGYDVYGKAQYSAGYTSPTTQIRIHIPKRIYGELFYFQGVLDDYVEVEAPEVGDRTHIFAQYQNEQTLALQQTLINSDGTIASVGTYVVNQNGYNFDQWVVTVNLDNPVQFVVPWTISNAVAGPSWALQTAQMKYESVSDFNFTAGKRDPFIVQFVCTGMEIKAYDIRITRVTDTPTTTPEYVYVYDEAIWSQYTYDQITESGYAINPDAEHSILELKIKATDQLNGVVDTLSAIVSSVLPVYDPVSKTWTEQITNNPAWIYCDILCGQANKRAIGHDRLVIDEIVEWAQECDLIAANDYPAGRNPDGTDYSGPQYTCNMVIDGQTTVKEALQNVASCGRASPVMRDTYFSVVREKENASPVQLFTSKNTNRMSATINYIDEIHGLKIEYLDAQNDFINSECRVYLDEYNEDGSAGKIKATVFETLQLPGTTNYSQAWRLGRYFLAEGILRRERITVDLNVEALTAQRGDLVLIASDVMKVGGLPRWVVSVSGTTVVLDEAVSGLNAIRLRASDQIINVTQTGDKTIEVPPGTQISDGDLIEYGVSTTIRADYIIESVAPGADLTATIVLVEHRPEVLDAASGPIPTRIPKPGAIENYAIGPVQGLIAVQSNSIIERQRYIDITLIWKPPIVGWPQHYLVEYIDLDNGFPTILDRVLNTQYKADSINVSQLDRPRWLQWQVTPITASGEKGPPRIVKIVINPALSVPTDPLFLHSNALTEQILLMWNEPLDLDLSHYEIRYSSDLNASWNVATRVAVNVPWDATEITVPLRPGLYFIKAISTSGNFSKNPAVTKVQVDDIEHIDFMDVMDFSAFNDGVFQNTILEGGRLVLTLPELEGWYIPNPLTQSFSFSVPSKVRLLASLESFLISIDEVLGGDWFDPLETAVPISPNSVKGQNTVDGQVYFRYSDGVNAIESFPWTRLIAADVTATEIQFAIRLTSKDPNSSPAITGARVEADWVERRDTNNDIIIPVGGTTVDFVYAFAKRPTIAITLENAGAGDNYVMSNVTNTGFDIDIVNSSGTSVGGQIDYIAVGFGKEY